VLTVVVDLVFGWWDTPKFVVDASVVVPVDPLEGGELETVEASPGSFVTDKLGLVETEDRFGQSVVVTAAA
jgi:hypothetical protein